MDGRFGWTGSQPNYLTDRAPYRRWATPELSRANEANDRRRAAELLSSGQMDFYMGGVSPGFDDIGCWGWGAGPRKVERDNFETYRFKWENMLKTNLRTVLIATWNDWNESTVIEPSVEDGVKDLEMTRTYAAKFDHKPEPKGDLRVPVWIYKVRKTAKGNVAALADMEKASAMIVGGEVRGGGEGR